MDEFKKFKFETKFLIFPKRRSLRGSFACGSIDESVDSPAAGRPFLHFIVLRQTVVSEPLFFGEKSETEFLFSLNVWFVFLPIHISNIPEWKP